MHKEIPHKLTGSHLLVKLRIPPPQKKNPPKFMLIMQRNLYIGPSGYTGLKNILFCLDLKVTLTFFHTLTLITLGCGVVSGLKAILHTALINSNNLQIA